jgi:hypothetical protein
VKQRLRQLAKIAVLTVVFLVLFEVLAQAKAYFTSDPPREELSR